MRKQLLLSAIITLIALQLNAQTYVSGGIYANTAWTLANSPYIVEGLLTLFPGDTLTIESGVDVKFDDGITFNVRGFVFAHGMPNDSIIFTSSSSNPQQGSWVSIYIQNDLGGTIDMDYCRISYAETAINIDAYNGITGPSFVKHSLITNNSRGTDGSISGGPLAITFDSCSFTGNYYALDEAGSTTVLKNCLIQGNNYGLHNAGETQVDSCTFCGNQIAVSGSWIEIHNSVFVNNGVAIYEGQNQKMWLYNCIISDNDTGLIVYQYDSQNYLFSNVAICNNHNYNLMQVSANNIALPGICWCDTNEANISALIYDGYDDANFGLVDFTPFNNCSVTLSSCSAEFTGIEGSNASSGLSRVLPNPFTNSTTIQFSLAHPASTSLQVLNVNGSLIATLLTKKILSAGNYEVTFDAADVDPGVYYYLLSCEQKTETGKLVLIR